MQKVHDPSKNSKWVDYPDIESPIIADELNRHETELDTIDSRVVVHETTKANQVDLLTCVASITLNTTTGILTITLKNGSSTTIDTGLSKVAVNFDYDADPTSPHYEQLILEMADGTYKYIDLSALITQFEFVNSSTITWTVGNDGTVTANIINGSITEAMLETNFLANCRLEVSKALGFSQDAEAWAKGTKGGTPVGSTDEHYHNNAKYYSEVAHTEADNATTKAQDSEAWAVGKRNGQDVPSTDETYHNNAKYWAEQAEGAVTGNDKVTWEANGVLGAKQLIPYPYYETTKTANGITFTDNGDGTITVNGTATSKVNFWLGHYSLPFIYPNGSYLLSDGGVGSSDVTLFFAYYNGTTWVTQDNVFDNGEIPIIVSHSASSNYDSTPIGINVKAGTTVSNLTFKPMLRLAEDTDSTYQPYAKTNKQLTDEINDKVDWVTNGKLGAKNLLFYPYPFTFPQTNHGITFTDNNGVIETSGTQDNQDNSIANVFNAWGTNNSIKLEPNTNYIISGCPSGGGESSYALQPVLTDSSNHHIWLNEFGDGLEFTTDSTHLYFGLRIVIVKGYTGSSLVFKPMLRLAEDTDDTYQPYAMTNKELTDELKGKVDWATNGKLGAKNLIPYPYYHTTRTVNGITWTVNDDGTVTANGTATERTEFSIRNRTRESFKLPVGKYLLSGCVLNGGVSTWAIAIYYTNPSNTGANLAFDYGRTGDIPLNITNAMMSQYFTIGISLVIQSGVTADNLVFKPMIRLASDNDDTYEPYAKTNQQLTKDSPFRFGVDGNGNYGYIKAGADTVTPFRNPKGNAVVANVLSGKTFANASSDELTGTMANYGGSNRRTITVSAGTGTQQISLSAGYHDSVIVDRTNAYNAGANAIRNTEWNYPVSAYLQKDSRDTERSTLYYRAYALGVKNNHGTKIVKDAVYGNAHDMYAIGVFTEMFGWESGSGSHVIQNLSDITTWTYDGDTYPAVLVTGKDLLGSNGVGQIVTWAYGTAYLSLYRKGIQ